MLTSLGMGSSPGQKNMTNVMSSRRYFHVYISPEFLGRFHAGLAITGDDSDSTSE